MTRPLKARAAQVPVSYTVPDAALATGIPADELNALIAADKLTAHWQTPRKKVVMYDDLWEYVKSLPTERPEVA